MAQSGVQFKLDHLAHLLADRTLHVPPYQRSYAWKEEQVAAFWTDLRDALNHGADEYFMGTVVSSRSNGVSTLIDGQQRLATTSLLLAALRDAYAARGDAARARGVQERYLASFDLDSGTNVPRMQLNQEDRDFYQTVVIDGDAHSPALSSHRRLAEAQDYLSRRVNEDLSARDGDWLKRANDWVRLLAERVSIIVIDVPDIADGFVIFETLNDRGAPLTISDLLRNYLMSRAGDDELDTVQEAWGLVLLNLGLSQEEFIFVDFFRQYWSSLHGATREKELFRSIRGRVTHAPSTVAFVQRLPEASRMYAALLDAQHEFWSGLPDEIGASVGGLLRLDLGQYRPLALAVLDDFDPDEQRRTFRALVAWAVRGLIGGAIGGGVTEAAYGRAAVAVREGEARTAEDLYRLLLPIIPGDRDFATVFGTASISRISVARYLLTSIERAEQGIVKPELVDDEFGLGLRLQSVVPKGASPEAWPAIPVEDLRAAATRLGNYVLLSESDGTLAKSPDFHARREILAKSPVVTTRSIAGLREWSLDQILQRQSSFADRAVAIWLREPPAE